MDMVNRRGKLLGLWTAGLMFLAASAGIAAEKDEVIGVAVGRFSADGTEMASEAEHILNEFRKKIREYGGNQFSIVDDHPDLLPGGFDEGRLHEIGDWKGVDQVVFGRLVHAPHGRLHIRIHFVDVGTTQPVKTYEVLSFGREEPYVRYAADTLARKSCGIDNVEESLAFRYDAVPLPEPPAVPEALTAKGAGFGWFLDRFTELKELTGLSPQDRQIFTTALGLVEEARERIRRYAEQPEFGGMEEQLYLADLQDYVGRIERVIRQNFFTWERAEAVEFITSRREFYEEMLKRNRVNSAAVRRFRWNQVLAPLSDYRFTERLVEDPVIRDVYGDVFGLFIDDDWRAKEKGYCIIQFRGKAPAEWAFEVTVTETATGKVYRKVVTEKMWELVFSFASGVSGDEEASLGTRDRDRDEIAILVEGVGEKQEVTVRPGQIEVVMLPFPAGPQGGEGFWYRLRTPSWKESGAPYGYFFDRGMTDIIRGPGNELLRLFLFDIYGGPAFYPSLQGSAGVRLGVNMILKDRITPVQEIGGARFAKSIVPALALGGGAFSLFYFTGNEAAAVPLGLMMTSYTLTGLLSSDTLSSAGGFVGGLVGVGLFAGLGTVSGYLAGSPVPTVSGTILGVYGGSVLAGLSSTLFSVNDRTAVVIFLISSGVFGVTGGLVGGLTNWQFLDGLSGGFISLIPAGIVGVTAGVLGGSSVDFSYQFRTFQPYGSVERKPSHMLTMDVLNLGWGITGFPINFFVRFILETNGGFTYNGAEYLSADESSHWDYYPVAGITVKGLEPLVFQGTVSGFTGGLGSRDLSVSGSVAFVTEHVDVGYTFSYTSSRLEAGAEPSGIYRNNAGEGLTPSEMSLDHRIHLNVRPFEWFTVYARAGYERLEYNLYEVAGGVTAGVVEELEPVVIDAELGIRIQVHNIFSASRK